MEPRPFVSKTPDPYASKEKLRPLNGVGGGWLVMALIAGAILAAIVIASNS
ncbi:hypothetical protein OKA05_03045 [Luteolibacter arcticus]|uniref:Uncharacterized protein n=1 Tax=Luteolibacter arcticus TaxID=1581411 RepID=A0ABT3GE13_9BACT|nr:hypothetical protein [Luteolibacter arcticus]MCW1921513.1 hypothetical protein [Luteolibacter arcticus]